MEVGGAVLIVIMKNIEPQATSFTTIPTPSPSKILVLSFLCPAGVCFLWECKLILMLA